LILVTEEQYRLNFPAATVQVYPTLKVFLARVFNQYRYVQPKLDRSQTREL